MKTLLFWPQEEEILDLRCGGLKGKNVFVSFKFLVRVCKTFQWIPEYYVLPYQILLCDYFIFCLYLYVIKILFVTVSKMETDVVLLNLWCQIVLNNREKCWITSKFYRNWLYTFMLLNKETFFKQSMQRHAFLCSIWQDFLLQCLLYFFMYVDLWWWDVRLLAFHVCWTETEKFCKDRCWTSEDMVTQVIPVQLVVHQWVKFVATWK